METKGSLFTEDLREVEEAKAKYGRAHFEALADGDTALRFRLANTVEQLLARL